MVEVCGIGEGLMGEVMRLEIAPDGFDVVEFGSVLGYHSTVSQCARAARAASDSLLTWIGPLSSTSTTGFAGLPGLGPKSSSSCSRWATKWCCASWAGVDDELAGDVIERPQHRHLLSLSRRGHAQVALPSPKRGRDRGASTPRFHRRRAERCRRLRPGVCAIAGASRSDPPRWRSVIPEHIQGVRQRKFFFAMPWIIVSG